MQHIVKSIPTLYRGAMMRSRLEARWAAFFDQCGWTWDYEPIDFEGWAPDFSIQAGDDTVYVEVKPVRLESFRDIPKCYLLPPGDERFEKAKKHWRAVWVLCLGVTPNSDADYFGIGSLSDPPREGAVGSWWDVHKHLSPDGTRDKWMRAGRAVQWNPSK